jgi:hypothetical protein
MSSCERSRFCHVGLHLAPGAAHGVLANGTAEQRAERAAHAPGIGPGEISSGDQRLGLPGQPLVRGQCPVAPFPRAAVRRDQAGARHCDGDRAERAEELAITTAVPVAVNLFGALVAAAVQRRVEFGFQHRLDEAADALAHPGLQRVEPVVPQKWQ